MIDWDELTKENAEIAAKIARRAVEINPEIDQLTIQMDISAASIQNDFDFERLLEFDEFNFMHDVIGINKHLNRDTGEITQGFLPRCGKREKTA